MGLLTTVSNRSGFPSHLSLNKSLSTAISTILTDASAAYVSSRERLIELLEEYRQAVIHHAVTRGLDPDVRLKPSSVEWLGDVPAHWELRD